MYLLDAEATAEIVNISDKTALDLCIESLKAEKKVAKKGTVPAKGSLLDRLIQTKKTLSTAMGVDDEKEKEKLGKSSSPNK